MDKVRFYRILDIDSADEFQYYENLSALLEEEEYIEETTEKKKKEVSEEVQKE